MNKNQTYTYNYTGSQQTQTLTPGAYQLQVWGAGTYIVSGGWSVGTLRIDHTITCYIYCGGQGIGYSWNSDNYWNYRGRFEGSDSGGFNGGGYNSHNKKGSDSSSSVNNAIYAGAGGTDIRINGTALNQRVIVAGGAGGSCGDSDRGGVGGGLEGGIGRGTYTAGGGTQTSGGQGGQAGGASSGYKGSDGSFGQGGNGWNGAGSAFLNAGGGGGGWYGGGGGGNHNNAKYNDDQDGYGGGGGSGFVLTLSNKNLSALDAKYCLINTNTVSGQGNTRDGMASITCLYTGCHFTTINCTSNDSGNNFDINETARIIIEKNKKINGYDKVYNTLVFSSENVSNVTITFRTSLKVNSLEDNTFSNFSITETANYYYIYFKINKLNLSTSFVFEAIYSDPPFKLDKNSDIKYLEKTENVGVFL